VQRGALLVPERPQRLRCHLRKSRLRPGELWQLRGSVRNRSELRQRRMYLFGRPQRLWFELRQSIERLDELRQLRQSVWQRTSLYLRSMSLRSAHDALQRQLCRRA
jgi:hypothetical protein